MRHERRRLRYPSPWWLIPFEKLGLYRRNGGYSLGGCMQRSVEVKRPKFKPPPVPKKTRRRLSVICEEESSIQLPDHPKAPAQAKLFELPFELREQIWQQCLCGMMFYLEYKDKRLQSVEIDSNIILQIAKWARPKGEKRHLLSIALTCRKL
jgi:hypothetical protein